jgi:hypothetical protein
MMAIRAQRRFWREIGIAVLLSGFVWAAGPASAGASSCACDDGRRFEPGAVSYGGNSDREVITRLEAQPNADTPACTAIWVSRTEIHANGTPYDFYLQRTAGRERRIDACEDSSDRFVKRSKTYAFLFGSDSTSIREMRPLDTSENIVGSAMDPNSKSNTNLWDSIVSEDVPAPIHTQERSLKIDHAREFNRTSWVFSRKDIRAHYVGISKDAGENEKLIPLNKTRKVNAGQVGQIEAADSQHAIVRFYLGSRIERFARAKNAVRRWYDNVGGPYEEVEDDLYTPLRAYIVEVSLDDIVEVNDYLDQAKTDRTRQLGL